MPFSKGKINKNKKKKNKERKRKKHKNTPQKKSFSVISQNFLTFGGASKNSFL